jgi:hypothetical protein
MLDYVKYLNTLARTRLLDLTCPHCGSDTKFIGGKDAFCNFCERYISAPDANFQKASGMELPFLEVHSLIKQDKWYDAAKKVDMLLKNNPDPLFLYNSALFYLCFSNKKYRERDYGLHGFMEQNAKNIRESLDLTSKWKEYFFKAIRRINVEIKSSPPVDQDLLFVKFMSEIKLGRLADSRKTLKMLHGSGAQSLRDHYAFMVYLVETDDKGAEVSLNGMLSRGEVNSFYYLVKYLAKHGKTDDAVKILKFVNSKANALMAQELFYRIESASEASMV